MVEFRFKFRWNLFPGLQLTINQHWFRQWVGAEYATSHYLNQCWPSSLTHICGTRGNDLNEYDMESFLVVLTIWNWPYGKSTNYRWKHLVYYWPFVRGLHRSPVDSPHKVPVMRSSDEFIHVLLPCRKVSFSIWGPPALPRPSWGNLLW